MSSRCHERAGRAGARVLLAALATLLLASCQRESREFEPTAPGDELHDRQLASTRVKSYEQNAYALATGKRLWTWYNCQGCHAEGGGGSGPALIDDVWLYGGDAQAVYRSIAEGRPNGMPAYGGRLSEDQLWQLTAYVRSMGALAPQDAAPNRDDAFLTRPPESSLNPEKPDREKPSSRTGQPQ